jgi:hypothetical protein
MISDSDSVNDGNEQRTVIHVDEQGIGKRGVSMRLVWQDISTLSVVWGTFYGIHSPALDIFENIYDTALMQLIAN